jgi:glycine betaine/proline transport system ATP-binding protein
MTDESQSKDIILRAEHLYKLYGANKAAAREMLVRGKEKDEIFQKTGVTVAVSDVSFEVERGKIFVLIGLSGSGKSTVVRCLNRLNEATSGKVYFEGQDIEQYSREQRLMSHRDVLGNVTYGLEVRGMKRAEREEQAMKMISMVGLDGWEHKSISALSGGMRQRVGIARALANNPDGLLMDEPFSALDPLVRRDMQFELLSIQEKLNKTVVFITHDINEAFKLGNLVSIMKDGKIIQTATPEEMSSSPADDYVENFINSADKAQIYSVRHIMQTPSCLIHSRDGANNALKQMREQGVSSAYVVGDKLELVGLLTLDDALRVKAGEAAFAEAIIRDLPKASRETLISDLLPVAAAAKFPIAVVDEDNHFEGIVTKAAVLGSLV